MMTAFKITNRKAIKYAECVNVPKIMIIYGENRAGKSTLLHALKEHMAKDAGMNNVILTSQSVESPGLEYAVDGVHRNVSLFRIISVLSRSDKNRRNAIAAPSSLPENKKRSLSEAYVYEPINKLLSVLSPHLRLARVDVGDNVAPRCVFIRERDSGNSNSNDWMEVSLDNLSTLEIEVITLFLPLLNHQIQQKLITPSKIRPKTDCRDTVVLTDMSDLFLPHELESQLLEYFRFIVREKNENIQFIIVTDSRALVDKASTEELFMLMPPERLEGGVNQLVKGLLSSWNLLD